VSAKPLAPRTLALDRALQFAGETCEAPLGAAYRALCIGI